MKIDNIAVLSGPGVYTFRLNGEIIYIGATTYGMSRCLNPNHQMAQFFRNPALELDFEPFENASLAFDEEAKLIEKHLPIYNVIPKDIARRNKRRYRAVKERRWLIDDETFQKLRNYVYHNK